MCLRIVTVNWLDTVPALYWILHLGHMSFSLNGVDWKTTKKPKGKSSKKKKAGWQSNVSLTLENGVMNSRLVFVTFLFLRKHVTVTAWRKKSSISSQITHLLLSVFTYATNNYRVFKEDLKCCFLSTVWAFALNSKSFTILKKTTQFHQRTKDFMWYRKLLSIVSIVY